MKILKDNRVNIMIIIYILFLILLTTALCLIILNHIILMNIYGPKIIEHFVYPYCNSILISYINNYDNVITCTECKRKFNKFYYGKKI